VNVKPLSILYWEAKRRLDLLTNFKTRVTDYYATARWDRLSHQWVENNQAKELRRQINEEMREVAVAAHFVGISMTMFYTSPAATGGPAGDISLLDNVFNLPSLRVSHAHLLDELDRAIGIYRSWLGPLWRRLFNPFYWFGWALTWIAEIPFRVLNSAGFNVTQFEGSFLGKTLKAAIQLVTGVGTALTILEKLDLLSSVVSAVHKVLGL
jgi:hypothetical protein